MSIKKELIKVYKRVTGQYKKEKHKLRTPAACYNVPLEVSLTNMVTDEDFQNNSKFISNMKKHKWIKPPKSFLCFLPYNCGGGLLAGGYRTIMAINEALSCYFKAKVYLCFFPIKNEQEDIEKFNNDVVKLFPKLNYEVVSYSDVWKLHVDVAMCNFWLGAYPLLKFNNCFEKYYLLQDHEALFFEAGIVSTLAEQTLRFGFYQFTNSEAIKNYIDFVNSSKSSYRYLPGIDHKIYYPLPNKGFNKEQYKIIFYGRPSIGRNCFYFVIEVLKKVKFALKDKVEIISVGEDYDVNAYALNGIITNYGRLNSLQKLAEIYRECDVGVSLISTPTFSYQHFEYMASGLCLVTNKQAGIADMLEDGKNAVVCEPIVDIMAKKMVDLINSPEQMKKISKNGISFTEKLDWNSCFEGIANFILRNKN